MKYKYVQKKGNYEDLAAGKVLYGAPGLTSFPVRLASEIYQRCLTFLKQMGIDEPYTLYDPCCGGAYMLTVIGFLHGETIKKIYASDIDGTAVEIAEKNLSLLNPPGLQKRMDELRQLYDLYEKESHLEALDSARRLQQLSDERRTTIDTCCFEAELSSALPFRFSDPREINVIMADVPYGNLVQWEGNNSVQTILDHLYPLAKERCVTAIVADKRQKIVHKRYKRLDYWKIGKRHAAILAPIQ